MSTYWGYRCETCDVNSEHWWNHANEELANIYRLWPMLKTTEQALDAAGIWHIEITHLNVHDFPSPLEFLHEHDGHAIALCNEYNQIETMGASSCQPALPST